MLHELVHRFIPVHSLVWLISHLHHEALSTIVGDTNLGWHNQRVQTCANGPSAADTSIPKTAASASKIPACGDADIR
jgi:hypothetical protein